MILRNDVVELVSMENPEDFKYLFEMIRRCDRSIPAKAYAKIREWFRFGWIGNSDSGVRGGVIYLSYYPELRWWMVHAYRDERVVAGLKRKDWSFEAANLVLKYFFENIGNRIYTVIDGNKRWTRKILNRLGFEEIGNFTTEIGQFDLFEKVQVK